MVRFVCILFLMFASFAGSEERRGIGNRTDLKIGCPICKYFYVDGEKLVKLIVEEVDIVEKVENIRVIDNLLWLDSLAFSVQLVDGSIHHNIECDVRTGYREFQLTNCGNDEVYFQKNVLRFALHDVRFYFGASE